MAKIPGLPVAFIAAGGVLVWSGIENQPVGAVLRALARGQAPQKGPPETFATPGQSSTSSIGIPGGLPSLGAGNGAAIAQDALTYQGHMYAFGGAPGKDGSQPWDCSSFVNWVVGHDMGLAIPGWGQNRYDGSTHGPPTGAWLLWGGVKGIKRADLQPGDLLVWQTHMGISLGGDQMISALGPTGTPSTEVTSIENGTPSQLGIPEVLFCKRLLAVADQPKPAPGSTSTIASAGPH